MSGEDKAQIQPETQVGAELNRLHDVMNKAESVFESLRQGISPILREDPPALKTGSGVDEVDVAVPRAREIQGIRIRLENLIRHITDTSDLSEA